MINCVILPMSATISGIQKRTSMTIPTPIAFPNMFGTAISQIKLHSVEVRRLTKNTLEISIIPIHAITTPIPIAKPRCPSTICTIVPTSIFPITPIISIPFINIIIKTSDIIPCVLAIFSARVDISTFFFSFFPDIFRYARTLRFLGR